MRAILTTLLIGVAALGLSAGSVVQAQEIKLGAFVTLSGISADVGAQMKAGIEVAVERMAPGFTVNGVPTPIKVIWYDDEGKGDTGSTS
jgi:ABC-type branched-subunit amino acid transport system substrate-binding protein